MSEIINQEKEIEKSATDVHFEELQPELWNKLTNQLPQERDQRWFALTQKHLNDYKNGISDEKFYNEELEFVFLNRLGEEQIPILKPETPQRGFFFNPKKEKGQRMEKFQNYARFVDTIKDDYGKHIKEQNKPYQILVSGIGISGKATLRNVLAKELRENYPSRKVLSWDRDYQKLFPIPSKWEGDIHIIEDVHALDNEKEGEKFKRVNGSDGLPNGFDMIVYVLPVASTYKQTLLQRGKAWLDSGKLDLTAPGEKEYSDSANQRITQTAQELERTLSVGQAWLKEQLGVLKTLKKQGIKIAVIEPSEIFKNLYNFQEDKSLINKSFFEALKEMADE